MANPREFKQDFDITDRANLGRPLFFHVDNYLDSVEQMIAADEVSFAFKMLESMPGWYRDHVPERATYIKNRLTKQLWGIEDYISGEIDHGFNKERLEARIFQPSSVPRGQTTATIVKTYNEQGKSPIIIELGPSDFWLPVGLKVPCELNFSYLPICLNPIALETIKGRYPGIDWIDEKSGYLTKLVILDKEPVIFVCYEVIEHMKDPSEITQHLTKLGIEPDMVLLSTPLYTNLWNGHCEWENNALGHLRTWTPREFLTFANDNFPGRNWQHMREFSQVVIGIKANTP